MRDSDRILGMLSSPRPRAPIEGKRAGEGAPADHPLQPEARRRGEMLSLEDIQDILRIKLIGVIPESGDRCCRRPTRACPPSTMKGSDVSEAYKDVGRPLPRRRAPAALRRPTKNRASSSACSEASDAWSLLSFLSAKRKRPPASPRSGCRSSSRTSAWPPRRSPITCPPCSSDLVAVISKYVQIDPHDIKVALEKQGNLRSAGSQHRVARGALRSR